MLRIPAIAALLLLMSCDRSAQHQPASRMHNAAVSGALVDDSFLDRLDGNCRASKVQPVALNDREHCFATALSAHCNPTNDCLVTCLVSGQGRDIGGGCWHICFQDAHSYARYQEPPSAARCRSLDPNARPTKMFTPGAIRDIPSQPARKETLR